MDAINGANCRVGVGEDDIFFHGSTIGASSTVEFVGMLQVREFSILL
jgi:hypothetical protein